MGTLDNGRGRYDGFDLEHLNCYGCAHSSAGVDPPGRPSGERPCGFCVRNRFRWLGDDDVLQRRWYDGSVPVSDPMDCYQTMDMKQQFAVWLDEAEHAGSEALNRLIDLRSRLKGDPDGRH